MKSEEEWNRPYYWFFYLAKKGIAFYSYLDWLEIVVMTFLGQNTNEPAH